MGGGGQSGSILLGLDGLLEFGEEAVVDGVGGSFGKGRGVISGRGFSASMVIFVGGGCNGFWRLALATIILVTKKLKNKIRKTYNET